MAVDVTKAITSTIQNNTILDSAVNNISSFKNKATQYIGNNNPLPKLNNIPTISGFVDDLINNFVVKPIDNGDDIITTLAFSRIDKTSIELKSQKTNHVLEDLSTVSDHVINEPIKIILTGIVADQFYKNSASAALLQQINSTFNIIQEYIPIFPPGVNQQIVNVATQGINTVNAIDKAVNQGIGLYNMFAKNDPNPAQTIQEKAFNQLRSLWETKQPVKILTPWRYFGDSPQGDQALPQKLMLITRVSFSNRENTDNVSDIVVELEEIRFAKTIVTKVDTKQVQSVKNMLANQVDNGQTNGKKENISVIKNIYYSATQTKPVNSNGVVNLSNQINQKLYTPVPSNFLTYN